MILSDKSIKEMMSNNKLKVSPQSFDLVQPASLDVTLADDFLISKLSEPIDPLNLWENMHHSHYGSYFIKPGEFILGSTKEYFQFPNDVVGELVGKSSLARLGLAVHVTAGYCDPGFKGTVTLEIVNFNRNTIKLTPGMSIGQMVFYQLDSPAEKPYGHKGLNSKYQGQYGVTESRYSE